MTKMAAEVCPRARGGKQPKAPNSVLIGLPNVLGPTLNELFQGAPNVTTIRHLPLRGDFIKVFGGPK
jgi:hypothetical protein